MADFWTDEREDQLITLFEEYPCLYDVSQKAYSNKFSKSNALRSIAEALASSTEEVNKKIHNLRTQYSRYLKLSPSGSKGGRTVRQIYILRRLAFLRPYLKKRTSQSNLEEKEDEIDVEGVFDEEEEHEEEEEGQDDVQSVPGPVPRPQAIPKRPRMQPEQALVNTVDNFIKAYTEQQKNKGEEDDIKAFCINLEKKMRRLKNDRIRFELERQVEEVCYEALMRDQAQQAYVGPSSSSQYQPYYQQL